MYLAERSLPVLHLSAYVSKDPARDTRQTVLSNVFFCIHAASHLEISPLEMVEHLEKEFQDRRRRVPVNLAIYFPTDCSSLCRGHQTKNDPSFIKYRRYFPLLAKTCWEGDIEKRPSHFLIPFRQAAANLLDSIIFKFLASSFV